MPNPVTGWQILSRDPEASSAFYSEVFGWKVDADNALGYRQISTESRRGIDGGIWPAPPEGHGFVQLFIEVEDLEQSVAAVEQAGGTTLVPPQHLPDGDRMAVLHDPQGLAFGLVQTSSG